MAFSTGNSQFDFLMSRARNRRRSKQALEENNINVETSQEKREDSESNDDNQVGSKVSDMSGLGAAGVSVGTISDTFTNSINQAQADINAANAIGGSKGGQNAADVAFGREMTAAKADFAQSNPVGAAIAGFSTDAIAQGVMQTAPLGLAMTGQIDAAKAVANIGGVLSGPAFGLISGLIGPSMKDPMGNTVAMGSGMLGKVSNSLMSMQFGIAEKAAKGTLGYAMGNYGGYALGVSPGIFGGLTFTGVNVPDIHQYSPTDFMADIEKAKAYAADVEPFGGIGSTSLGGQGISVDSYSSPTAAAMDNSGYSSYGPTGAATGAAPAGSQYSKTGIFSSPTDDNNNNNDGTDGGYGGSSNTTDYGGTRFGGKITKKKKMALGGLSTKSQMRQAQSGLRQLKNSLKGSSYQRFLTFPTETLEYLRHKGDDYDEGERNVINKIYDFRSVLSPKPQVRLGDVPDGMAQGGDVEQNPEVVQGVGFIDHDNNATPQEEIKDDKPLEAKEGDFIINAPAAELMGKQNVEEMIFVAVTSLQEKGVDVQIGNPEISTEDNVKLLVSKNEVYIPKVIAEEIGYDKLEKINNRGKKEVSRRQQEAEKTQDKKPQARQVAGGGFIGMKEGGDVEDDYGVTIENVKFKNFYSSPQIARKEIDKILNQLPLEDALAIAMEGEADVLGNEGLEGVGHVFRNRAMAEGYKDFGNPLVEELGKKTYGKNKIFQFNALEPTKFRKTLKRFKENKSRYLKVRNIAEDIVAGSRKDFTGGALFFKNPSSSEAQDFKSKVNSGEYIETGRTVNPKNKVFAHIYYKPKDFKVTDEMPTQVEESFVSVNNDDTQSPRKIPESTGGSFLGRGSEYETGGAKPAFR